MQLIVTRLRRDLKSVQSQLLNLDGWGDAFVKTRQISYRDARVFERQFLSQPELNRPDLEGHEFGRREFEREAVRGANFPACRADEAVHSDPSPGAWANQAALESPGSKCRGGKQQPR